MSRRTAPLQAVLAVVSVTLGMVATVPAAAAVPEPAVWAPASTLVPARPYFQPDPYQVLAVSTPANESVAVWGDDQDLLVSIRQPDAPAFPAGVVIAEDGYFSTHLDGSAPDLAVSPTGTVTVAWLGLSQTSATRIETATRQPRSTTWAKQVIATGIYQGEVHVAVGADGTAAVTWSDGVAVSVAVRGPADGSFSAPQVVSDPVTSNVTPLVQNPRVAVSADGSVTVGWGAYNGDVPGAGRSYRLRATALAHGATTWSDPVWVSAPGQAVYSPVLQAGTDGSVTQAWLSSDGASPVQVQAATLSSGSWSGPAVLGDHAENGPQLAAGPDGVMTAGWQALDSDQGPYEIRTARYDPAGGWGASAPVVPPTIVHGLSGILLAASADGTLTAGWAEYNGSWTLQTSSFTGTSWSAPTQVGVLGTLDGGVAMSVSPAGWVTAVYNEADNGSERDKGMYVVRATATIRPQLVASGVRVSGTPRVGCQLTASVGTWNLSPATTSYQWLRDGHPIPGATRQSYLATSADSGHLVSVVVTAQHAGYRDGSATSVKERIAPYYLTAAYIAAHRVGAAVYLNGLIKLADPHGGSVRAATRTVYLQRYVAGSWLNLLSRTTDGAGIVAVGFIQSHKDVYRWYVPPTVNASGTVSMSVTA